jgi:membrane protein YfhO
MSPQAANLRFERSMHEPAAERRQVEGNERRIRNLLPLVVVSLVCSWSAWSLRATLTSVSYLDDASVHEQMVRFATQAIRSGHNPLTQWFPYLGEGSPQFLHYQSLGALLTGLLGVLIGPNTAFRWSLWLLVALWPISIYASARILSLSRWTAASAAALSPFVVSVPAVGYEHGAYLWIGFGLWTQLWASWTLPLAWAFTWRAMEEPRFLVPAAICVALTIGFHFETGYLALLAVLLFPWVAPSRLRVRARRACVLFVVSLAASAWAWVPLIVYGKWAAINEVLRNTPLENGYGAGRVMSWLVTGRVYDAGRFPVISILVMLGIIISLRNWRHDSVGRALVAIWTACLLLSFGRTTFHGVVDIIPGSSDLFFRRFMMGAQLAGLMLAGLGCLAIGKATAVAVPWVSNRLNETEKDRRIGAIVLFSIAVLGGLCAVLPAPLQIERFDARNASAIARQHREESAQQPAITPLVAYIKNHGGGRTYAGLPTNWGEGFTVGMVPVFKYLESQDVDEVGYTLRTASLMTDPEYYFDQRNPGDYTLFGIRYLLLPSTMSPPTPATAVMRRGKFRLWEIRSNGYLDVVQTTAIITENRGDIATQSMRVLESGLISHHNDVVVAFAGSRAPLSTESRTSNKRVQMRASEIVSSGTNRIQDGLVGGVVHLSRPAVVMLSASYDPGWHATVDGEAMPTEMLAPAVVGVAVGKGEHRVVFTYQGFAYYPELVLIGGIALVALSITTLKKRQSR